MFRFFRNFLILALFCPLVGCSPAAENLPTESSAPAASAVDTPAQAEPEHLPFYDQFDGYNNSIDEHDFFVSEAEYDGKLCYKLENVEHGICIYVRPGERAAYSQATLCYQDRMLTFEMPAFILGGGNASFNLQDLTGDGTLDLIYIHGGGGTGSYCSAVQVFDLASMTECPVLWDSDALSQYIQLTPVELRDTEGPYPTLVHRITGPDGLALYGTEIARDAVISDTATAYFGNYEMISLEDGRLALSSGFCSEYALPFNYIGSLEGHFIYDLDAASFVLQPPFTLTIDNPVNLED